MRADGIPTWFLVFALLSVAAPHLSSRAADPETLWVSPQGSDGDPGSPDRPLATIGAALARGSASRIVVRAGTYELDRALALGARNNGVTVEAETPGSVYISGRLKGSEATFDSEKGIWHLPAQSCPTRVWLGGKPVPSATTDKAPWHFIDASNEKKGSADAFHPEPGDLKVLSDLSAPELDDVQVVLFHSWAASRHRIKSLDRRSGSISLDAPAPWPLFRFGTPQRYRLENVPSRRPNPGAWSCSSEGQLYYAPMPGDASKPDLAVPHLDRLLSVDHAQGITLRGLTFRYAESLEGDRKLNSSQAASGVGAAIVVANASGVTFDNIAVQHVSGYGVWLAGGVTDSKVVNSDFEDLGAGGLRIGITQSTPKPGQETRRVVVDNNVIRSGGLYHPGAVAILVGHAADSRITHNDISDFSYTGISVGWTWSYGRTANHDNVISGNHIHAIGEAQLSDVAGIYTLGESPGTSVTANVIHDVFAYDGVEGWGLYADQASSGIAFERNLVYRTTGGGFHQNFGHGNVVRHNVFAFGRIAQISLQHATQTRELSILDNVVLTDNQPVFAGDWKPDIAAISGNLYWDLSQHRPSFLGEGKIIDPGFVDPRAGDFRLKSGEAWDWRGASPIKDCGVHGTQAARAARSAFIRSQAGPQDLDGCSRSDSPANE